MAAPTVLVLRDVVAADRPPAPERVAAAPVRRVETVDETPALPEPAPELTVAPVLGVARPPVVEAVEVTATESMLARLTATETDERPVLRRIAAFVVLLVLTLTTAALVGAGIYQAVAGLG